MSIGKFSNRLGHSLAFILAKPLLIDSKEDLLQKKLESTMWRWETFLTGSDINIQIRPSGKGTLCTGGG